MTSRSVFVAGGGLAGLAAALTAARAGHRVTVAEGGTIGRDKVCGEFLSPEVAADFDALGCGSFAQTLGAVAVRRVAIFGAGDERIDLELPGPPGFCVTRRALETYLADRARAHGVTVFERAQVKSLTPARGRWLCRAGEAEREVEALICAFGKRSTLDAPMGLPRASAPEPYVAAKAYFKSDFGERDADVELFLLPDGYVGLNPVEGDRLGLCALLTGEPTSDFVRLRERFAANRALARRVDRLGEPLGAVRGLAKFGFGPQRVIARDAGAATFALFAGDCARMMPSFTGDGMAVALRSGRLAARALAERDPASSYERSYAREFDRRFRFAGALHRAFLNPWLFGAVAPIVGRSSKLVERIYAWTRGGTAA